MSAYRLPAFIIIPLMTAFILPVFGKKGKSAATILANLATVFLFALSISCLGQREVYEVGRWSFEDRLKLLQRTFEQPTLLPAPKTVYKAIQKRFSRQYPN